MSSAGKIVNDLWKEVQAGRLAITGISFEALREIVEAAISAYRGTLASTARRRMMTDPLTYLDEVDALWRDDQSRPGGTIAQQEILALSKALRTVLDLHQPHLEGSRHAWCTCCAESYPCRTVQAIRAALAVNDEGGK